MGWTVSDDKTEFPERLRIRDTKLNDDMGGLGQRIYTTAGAGYEKREYVCVDLYDNLASALDMKDKRIAELEAIAAEQLSRLTALTEGITEATGKEGTTAILTHIGRLEADNAELRAVADAADCIRHWHDSANDGMVVSAEHVHKLWGALAALRQRAEQESEG